MKTLYIASLLIISISIQAQFDNYFENKSLRIDYEHSGNANEEYFALKDVMVEPYWGGSHLNLVDTFRYGNYFFEVINPENDSILYSRGFSTLFGEWQTTNEAQKIKRSFTESLIMPLPKQSVTILLYSRDAKGIFQEVFSYNYSDKDYFVRHETPIFYPSFDVFHSGDPSVSVDILIIPEGYAQDEMGNFIEDCHRFSDILFSFEPYTTFKDRFNIKGILSPSIQSGSDIPKDSLFQNTLLNSSFYTFDSERYCMTYDYKKVRDIAANAPYDQIYILVNTDKYGGGAIYNYYSISVSGNFKSSDVFIHEFGHGFAGLGDEYYTSDVSYNDFYPAGIEPWEPNLTTMVDFDSKWKNLLDPHTPIPTPNNELYANTTGVFEGGGYVAKGVYRPAYDCLMKSFNGHEFCDVCQKAIIEMILFYSTDDNEKE